uniref:PH-like domain-containing protein n=1 Tax=Trypanosoma congolense (strain IL3000) TaxID=1068625 RepID=G0UTL4_TRYCI|nr:conserved hypothetical protein [Trypanosoma congolense IL3000]
MSSVQELLRLPIDKLYPYEQPLNQLDESVILGECGAILRKCLYAVRYMLIVPFNTLFSLLVRVADRAPEKMTRVLLEPIDGDRPFDLLVNMCGMLLSPSGKRFRRGIDMGTFLRHIQTFCCNPLLRDSLGEFLLDGLITLLCETAEEEDDYRQPRECASLLITFIRGSKINKDRMSSGCREIERTLTGSTDIYLQMQCVELIYRLYIHNRMVLASSTLCESLKKGIARLPNNESLLESMELMLHSYNVERQATRMHQFTVFLIEAGNVEVCGHTRIYFSPLILVIMLPQCAGDNITIPYEHVQGIRMSRDCKLVLRLHVIPPKLLNIMSTEAGKCTLLISLTQTAFNAIRSAGIHDWITARKRRGSTALKSSGSNYPAKVDRKITAEPKEISRGARENVSDTYLRIAAACSEGDGQTSLRHRDADADRLSHQNGLLSSQGIKDECQKDGGTMEVDGTGMLDELHEIATQKATRMRDDCRCKLQPAVDSLNEEIERMRRTNASERDAFEASVREELNTIRRIEGQVTERATECVQLLNQELEGIQELGELLKNEIEKLRDCLVSKLHQSETTEVESLTQVKSWVDAEMKSMKEKLAQVITSTNPLSILTARLSQQGSATVGKF